jgi:ATP synthase protein I
MTQKNSGDSPWRAAGMVGVMGLDFAVSMFIGYWIGDFARDRLGGSIGWLLGGLLIGLAIGIISVAYLIKNVLEDSNG